MGTTAIKYRGEKSPRVHVSAERRADEWVLSVEDDGIGMASDESEQIFEAFSRLHGNDDYPGTGIGLSLCQNAVENHGGRVWVDSRPGEGSTFYVALPTRPTTSTRPNLYPVRVPLVEDGSGDVRRTVTTSAPGLS